MPIAARDERMTVTKWFWPGKNIAPVIEAPMHAATRRVKRAKERPLRRACAVPIA